MDGLLGRDECQSLCRRVLERNEAPRAIVTVESDVASSTRLVMSDLHTAEDSSAALLSLTVGFGNRLATAKTSRLDDAGLAAVVNEASRLAHAYKPTNDETLDLWEAQPAFPPLALASADSAAPASRAGVLRSLGDAAAKATLNGAANLSIGVSALAVMNTEGLFAYDAATTAQLTITMRAPRESGSGWTGAAATAWSRIDAPMLTDRAIDIAKRSDSPVGIEPGRYVVILEPQAVAALLVPMVTAPTAFMDWPTAERGTTAYAARGGGTLVGLRMMDSRLSLLADPRDPDAPFLGMAGDGLTLTKVVWIDAGILRTLAYDRHYGTAKARTPIATVNTTAVRMTGGTESLSEMIASTRRGIWVNRFSAVTVMDSKSLQLTGVTRDGAFLIENGKISKPIKNLRFTDSPLSAFNRVEAVGESSRVIAAAPTVVPRLKFRDFRFTSTSDAI